MEEIELWLYLPISELEIWHLILMMYVVGHVTSSDCNCGDKK